MFKYRKAFIWQLNNLIFVAFGAIPGSLIRWQIDDYSVVNLLGAGLLGFVIGYKLKFRYQLLVGVGFCGSLTTFSSWILDSFKLLVNGFFIEAISLIIFQLCLGLLVMAIGYWIGFTVKSSSIRKSRFFSIFS